MLERRFFGSFAELERGWRERRVKIDRLVFTNGCFDLLHAGHVTYLEEARSLGTYLVVGLNSDTSVSRLKGSLRPINRFEDRGRVLAALRCVDLVVGFTQDTPRDLIEGIDPDILVKGGDWPVAKIVGSDWVLERGGSVRSLSLLEGYATSEMIDRIVGLYGCG